MAAIGQLIMYRNIGNATNIFRELLIIARSKTEGALKTGKETTCEREKWKLKSIITGKFYLSLLFSFDILIFWHIDCIMFDVGVGDQIMMFTQVKTTFHLYNAIPVPA